jgi:hypothetical protein
VNVVIVDRRRWNAEWFRGLVASSKLRKCRQEVTHMRVEQAAAVLE